MFVGEELIVFNLFFMGRGKDPRMFLKNRKSLSEQHMQMCMLVR